MAKKSRTARATAAPTQAPAAGSAFAPPVTDTPAPLDVAGFDPRAWASGTALVTRSVAVCGRPDLMGHIEALKDELERTQAAELDDDRPMAKSNALALAQALEAARADMLGSMVTFTFRGLRPGELETISAAHGPVDEADQVEGVGNVDYKIWAAQCVRVTPANGGKPSEGIDWEVLRILHRGDGDQVQGLGMYFMRTIAVTANVAAQGGGVDIPFSSASSALTSSSPKS